MKRAEETNILVIEDERPIRLLLSRILVGEGFLVTAVASARDARDSMRSVRPDIVLLDLGLPDEDGFSLQKWLRHELPDTAVIILSGRDHPKQRVQGLDGGADDYVTKPFVQEELLARIRSILRRVVSAKPGPEPKILHRFMEGFLDPDLLCLQMENGQILQLSAIEFKILSIISERPGRVISRESLLDHLGAEEEVGLRSCDYHIFQLRKKFRLAGIDASAIVTVRGVGYLYQWPSAHPACTD